MNPILKSQLNTPLIGKVYTLDDYIEHVSTLPPKRMQRLIVEPMMSQVSILHLQAIRELRGLDYYKRAKETVLEIQAAAYRVYHKKGWSLRVASVIDGMCDDILEELAKYHFAMKAKSAKSTDESGSANL